MKNLLLITSLSISLLFSTSCQQQTDIPTLEKKSPLEMMVDDYVAKIFPNWLDSIRTDGDTLYLHVNFFHYDKSYSSIRITDSTSAIDVIASVGGAENLIVYPKYRIVLPLPPIASEDLGEATKFDTNAYYNNKKEYIESFIQELTEMEKDIYGKDYIVPPAFDEIGKKYHYFENRWSKLYDYIDSLHILDTRLIGYTYFGPVQVIILADKDIDKSLVEQFLKEVNVMDLRPRYIWHKENEEEIYFDGWGEFNVYGIDSLGKFKQVGEFLID